MKNPITKLAIAAAIIAAVVLGLFEFIDTGGTSGVVWADVAQKVQASPGVIFRVRATGSEDSNDDWPHAHIMIHRSAKFKRTEWFRGAQVHRSVYFNLDAKTKMWLAHDAKVYIKETMSDEEVGSFEGGFTDPQALVSLFIAGEYQELGEKTIEGVLCKGIETTDLGPMSPAENFLGRLWVSVETGYPILAEWGWGIAEGNDGNLRRGQTADQFQWNVDIVENEIEPEIPADFTPMT